MQGAAGNGVPILVVLRHFWFLPLVWSFGNAVFWWIHARQQVVQQPSFAWPYGRLIARILIVFNAPWLVLGAALELPGSFPALPSLPLIIAFLVSFTVSSIVSIHWLFYREGAEILVYDFDAFIPRNPSMVKWSFLSSVWFTILGMALILWLMLAP